MSEVEDAGTYALVGGAQQVVSKRVRIQRVVDSSCFRCLSLVGLAIALFGTGIATLLDLPDSISNLEMDILMTSIAVFFIFEIVLSCIAESAGKIRETNSNLRILTVRSARAARIGARAGRLSRPLRLLTHLLRGAAVDHQEPGYSARVLGARLTQVFSSKVAMLTVVLVLGVPLFNIGRYPEDDFSLSAWGNKLEADYARDFYALANKTERDPHAFRDAVLDMRLFYDKLKDYYPFRLDGYSSQVDINGVKVPVWGAGVIHREAPNRKQNILRQETSHCSVIRSGCNSEEKAAIYFDFTVSTKHDALLDMAVTVFIVMCMLVESFDLNFSIDRMMVKPMERMLDSARLMSKDLQQTLSKSTGLGKNQEAVKAMTKELKSYENSIEDDDDLGVVDDALDEIEMLQSLFKKVVLLIRLCLDEEFTESNEAMDVGSTNNIGYNIENSSTHVESYAPKLSVHQRSEEMRRRSSQFAIREKSNDSAHLGMRPSSWNDKSGPESWGFDATELTPPKRKALADHVLFKSDIGAKTGKLWLDSNAFEGFYIALEAAYNHNQFHNFIRALDVLACSYRWLYHLHFESWFSDLDATAILISSLACDVAHPGRTNQFLVMTADAVALHYNDRSPLENMHCAKLFEIQRIEQNNVFKRLDKPALGQMRKTCIEAILCTDASLHPELVKDVKKIYAMHSDMCDAQRQSPHMLATKYISDVLRPHTQVWRKSLLHLADLSNPCQKFHVARAWAERLQEELFLQGDEERRLGLPVGQQHDREKVTLPGAQFGFISLTLSPLMIGMLHIYPMMSSVAEQMVETMREWHKLWCKEPSWKPALNVQRRERIQKISDQVSEFLVATCRTSMTTTATAWEAAGSVRRRSSLATTSTHMSMSAFNSIDLSGHWTCINTWGLEEFLKSINLSWARRKAAISAPWPSWDFQQSGDNIVFNNFSALGVLRLEFTVNGEPFTQIDGWKQKNRCRAFWENKMLIIEKDGPQGTYREERSIDADGRLQFTLQPLEPAGPAWGRTFEATRR